HPGAPVGAAALRPATADPLVVRGRELALTLTATRLRLRTPGTAIELRLGLTPLTGAPARSYELGEVRLGQHTYSAAVDCPDGCRLSFIMIDFRGPVDGEFEFTLESVDQRGPDTPLATGAQLGRWWGPESGVLRTEPTGRGLGLSASSGLFDRDGLRLRPPDTPASLPVLDAGGSDPGTVLLGGDEQVATTVAARAALLPRLGPAGTVADLEYLTRLGEVFAASQAGEVWLGPAAPADAADRFRRAGLTVTGERGLADEVRAAQRRPSAVGTRFLLAVAVLSLILGASGLAVAAGVERGARAEELRWLRTQGLPRRQARRAVLASYLGVVVVAVVLGGLAAVVAWYLTGDRLPLSDTPTATMLIPDLPGVGAYLAWATGAAALGLVALLLSGALVRMIDTTAPSHRARRAR
ncbi:MAG TPA: FtsX-like permease family protein, partial [Micromonosporaceae bacterium]